MAGSWLVREATQADAAGCAEVYAPYVRDTAISFETEPPDAAEMAARIAAAVGTHAWVVLEDAGRVAGYAYGAPFMTRPAYRWSTSVSVYTERGRRRPGAGRALYAALFDRLAARGYRMAFAGIVLPNEASVGLHRALGFQPSGTYRRVGWKLGRWHDVAWSQRPLGDTADDDGEPEPPC